MTSRQKYKHLPHQTYNGPRTYKPKNPLNLHNHNRHSKFQPIQNNPHKNSCQNKDPAYICKIKSSQKVTNFTDAWINIFHENTRFQHPVFHNLTNCFPSKNPSENGYKTNLQPIEHTSIYAISKTNSCIKGFHRLTQKP